MSDTSGSWPSGCPEKYPWIGGDEPIEQWPAEWAEYSDEQDDATSSRDPTLVHMENVNRDLIAINRGLTEDNQALSQRNLDLTERNRDLTNRNLDLTERNHDLTERNLGLGERLHATEDNLARREEELTSETSMNEELTNRVASLSTYICKLWMELATSKGRERRAHTIIIVMVLIVILLAFVKKYMSFGRMWCN